MTARTLLPCSTFFSQKTQPYRAFLATQSRKIRDLSETPAFWALNHLAPYLIELATDENTLLAFAYSAMSCPSSAAHALRRISTMCLPPEKCQELIAKISGWVAARDGKAQPGEGWRSPQKCTTLRASRGNLSSKTDEKILTKPRGRLNLINYACLGNYAGADRAHSH